MNDKRLISEEPDVLKGASPVLEPSMGGDAHAQVNYNRLLQCFVLLDLKMDKITHQDLGQLQMYVNYYDRAIRESYENPTIGVLLCADKNDAVVRYTLAQNNTHLFASKYQLHLPTEQQLMDEIRKELPDEDN